MLLPQLNQPPYFLSTRRVVLPWHSLRIPTLRRRSEKKGSDRRELTRGSASTMQEPDDGQPKCQKCWSAVIGPAIRQDRPLQTARQTVPHKAEIQPDSKLSCAQKSCQKGAQIIQCIPGCGVS